MTVASFDRFMLAARPPRLLQCVNLLLHGVAVALCMLVLRAGAQPASALIWVVVLIAAHAAHEHGVLARTPRRIRIDGVNLWLDADIRPWRLVRVHAANAWLMSARVLPDEASQGRRGARELVFGRGQLDPAGTHRLVRWLRSGVAPG